MSSFSILKLNLCTFIASEKLQGEQTITRLSDNYFNLKVPKKKKGAKKSTAASRPQQTRVSYNMDLFF